MASDEADLLPLAEEDAIHHERLLPHEIRPYQRLQKRLLALDSAIIRYAPTLPPDRTADSTELSDEQAAIELKEIDEWWAATELDFTNYELFIQRMQFNLTMNEEERTRYAAQKTDIQEKSQAVKEDIEVLKVQLQEEQEALAVRKSWDELAEKITGNRMLKPRDEQDVSLEKLRAEIAELENEGQEIKATFEDRKERFTRMMAEGKAMVKAIRGEPDEPEADEEDDGDLEMKDGDEDFLAIPRQHNRSGSNTPGFTTPRQETGVATPVTASPGAAKTEGDQPSPGVTDTQLTSSMDANMTEPDVEEGEEEEGVIEEDS